MLCGDVGGGFFVGWWDSGVVLLARWKARAHHDISIHTKPTTQSKAHKKTPNTTHLPPPLSLSVVLAVATEKPVENKATSSVKITSSSHVFVRRLPSPSPPAWRGRSCVFVFVFVALSFVLCVVDGVAGFVFRFHVHNSHEHTCIRREQIKGQKHNTQHTHESTNLSIHT